MLKVLVCMKDRKEELQTTSGKDKYRIVRITIFIFHFIYLFICLSLSSTLTRALTHTHFLFPSCCHNLNHQMFAVRRNKNDDDFDIEPMRNEWGTFSWPLLYRPHNVHGITVVVLVFMRRQIHKHIHHQVECVGVSPSCEHLSMNNVLAVFWVRISVWALSHWLAKSVALFYTPWDHNQPHNAYTLDKVIAFRAHSLSLLPSPYTRLCYKYQFTYITMF